MKFIELEKNNLSAAENLFMQAVRKKEILYKPFENEEDFFCFFLKKGEKQLHKIAILEETGTAFAAGCYVEGEDRAYITFVTVFKEVRRQGIGTAILGELEQILLKESGVKKTEIIFFNPMAFSWNIPDGKGADHPNAPGVDISSKAYLFFKNCRYRDYAAQNSYYLNLADYQVPKSMGGLITQLLKEENITFEVYDANKHYGLECLMHKFGNPLWEKEILGEVQKKIESRPVMIVSHNGKTVGFAGPMDVEKSGRGYFAGIGVDNEYRGKGIAKVLFCKLCIGLKDKEAGFMTLFTGETNPARNIYEAAGFKIVRTWSDMRKEWKDS